MTSVHFTDDAAEALDRARAFLESRPVEHNLILTLLHGRIANPQPGRYWLVERSGRTTGVVFQSPVTYHATITPMSAVGVRAVVDAIVGAGIVLPGVTGDAQTAARFAGRLAEQSKTAASPAAGQRLYKLGRLREPKGASGKLRVATNSDIETLVLWMDGFSSDTGDGGAEDNEVMVRRRVDADEFVLWEVDGTPVSTAAGRAAFAGVTRIGPVYTPPEHRSLGYAGACVGALSRQQLAAGFGCILYTQLANPVSNSVYQRLGYRAVAEILHYRFGD